MQTGFDPSGRHLGTPIEPRLREAIAAGPPCLPANDHATRLLDALWLSPDLAFNEKDALFVRAPTVLQGLNLTNPPNGGFSTAARSVVVGAGPGGPEFNTRLSSTVFLQPGYPGKRMEVGPADGAQVSPLFPPFREPDGKTRSPHGHMTIARMDQEAAANAARAAAAQDMFDPPLEPELEFAAPTAFPYASMSSPLTRQASQQTQVQTQVLQSGKAAASSSSSSYITAPTSPAQALAALERAVAAEVQESGAGSRATPLSPRKNPKPEDPNKQQPEDPGTFGGRLAAWWQAFTVAPMEPATWAQNDQWVPITIIFMAVVVVALLCIVVSRR